MGESNHINWEDCQKEVEAEIEAELRQPDPVYNRFVFVAFVSRSNGRDRKPRKHPREIELLYDCLRSGHDPVPRFVTFDRYPFDDSMREVYPGIETDPNYYSGLDEKLQSDIRQRARKDRC